MKWLIRIGAVLAALFAVAAAAFYVYFDAVVSRAVEQGASEALGVPTRAGFVRVAPLVGEIRGRRLRVRNPEGFRDRNIVEVESAELAVTLGALRQGTIEVPRLELIGVDVSLERSGDDTNYGVIQRNLQRFRDGRKSETGGGEGSGGGGPTLIFREIVIRDIRAEIDVASLPGELDRVKVNVPVVRLRNIGSAAEGGVSISEASGAVFAAVMLSVAKQAPASIAGNLIGELAGLRHMAPQITREILGDSFSRSAADAARSLGRGARRAFEGIGDLIRGRDRDE